MEDVQLELVQRSNDGNYYRTRSYESAEQSPHSGSTDVELTVKTTCYLPVTCRTMITDDDNDKLIERDERSNSGETRVTRSCIIVSHIYLVL